MPIRTIKAKLVNVFGIMVFVPSPGELPLHPLRGDLRDLQAVRRGVLPRRWPAPRLSGGCQRRSADGRTQDPRRADPYRLEARCAGDDRRPWPCAHAPGEREHG